jgi:hypothetical protein
VPFVAGDAPVHGWELDDILQKSGVKPEPGDAIAVYCEREKWQADPETPYGRPFGGGPNIRPGLHVSRLRFLRDHDRSFTSASRKPAPRSWSSAQA